MYTILGINRRLYHTCMVVTAYFIIYLKFYLTKTANESTEILSPHDMVVTWKHHNTCMGGAPYFGLKWGGGTLELHVSMLCTTKRSKRCK